MRVGPIRASRSQTGWHVFIENVKSSHTMGLRPRDWAAKKWMPLEQGLQAI